MLLALVMTLAALPAAPFAAAAETREESVGAESAETAKDGKEKPGLRNGFDWADLQNRINTASAGETVALTMDLTAEDWNNRIEITNGKNIIFDLNGHTLDRALDEETAENAAASSISTAPQSRSRTARAEGMGEAEWTVSESETALTLIKSGVAPVAAQNGDTMLTVWFSRIGEADKVNISFTFGEEHELSSLTYVSNAQEISSEVRTVNGSITFNESALEPTLLSDVDLDGEITAADALLVMRHAMSIITVEGQGFVNGDMDGDGLLTTTDAILIMRLALDIE